MDPITRLELERCALALSTHCQVSFEEDLQLVNVWRWQSVIEENCTPEYDSVIVQHDVIPRRCGELPKLTICHTDSLGLSRLGARFAGRTVRVRVVDRSISCGQHPLMATILFLPMLARAGHARRSHRL
jgi:hypothetical protein